MLKILFSVKRAERHPVEMMVIGFFYASISILLSFFILPEYSSLIIVFFTVISCLYVVQKAIIVEERRDRDVCSEEKLLRYHAKALYFLLFLFLGFVAAFTLWTIILPYDSVNSIFSLQSSAIREIKNLTGNAFANNGFSAILFNNLKVVLISFFLALFYGAGAIFILVWNASVMGFIIVDLARNTFGLASLPAIISKYFLHGLPEMTSYFTATLAGGILFISLINGDILSKPKKIAFDIFLLIFISLALLVSAALIEVYITPII
jgi:uncharacterized membrane protein SpoIIM required for sporulation